MQKIGRLLKVVGMNRGIVSVWHDPFCLELIPHQAEDFIFVELDGLFVPFQIQNAEERADGATVLYFKELSDGITADELVGCDLYLPDDLLGDNLLADGEDEAFSLDWFVGCWLIDQSGKDVGEIVDYEQYSLNMLLVVARAQGDEVLIPFHPDLVLRLPSEDAATLQLQIAEGLLED